MYIIMYLSNSLQRFEKETHSLKCVMIEMTQKYIYPMNQNFCFGIKEGCQAKIEKVNFTVRTLGQYYSGMRFVAKLI